MIRSTRKRQLGMTVIELMIALALGLFITAGLISLFVNSKQSYLMNENMARLQENARFAVSFIARDIRMTDYRACLIDARMDDALAGTNGAGEAGTDTITMVWQTNLCGAAGATRTIVYSIQDGVDGGRSLFRSVNGGDAEELVQGIEDMQLLFGEDTDDSETANFYASAAGIADMAQVISVKLTVIARTLSLEAGQTLDGSQITRSFSTTIALRNRLP